MKSKSVDKEQNTGNMTNDVKLMDNGNLKFIKKQKEKAETYHWLYHFTSSQNALNIIKSREFWCTSLKEVNDREEASRIDIPEYEDSYYVGCFSYELEHPDTDWNEYGGLQTGVLIGFRKEWFKQECIFMSKEKQKRKDLIIFHDIKSAGTSFRTGFQKTYLDQYHPFFMFEFEFYQIEYAEEEKRNILGVSTVEIDGYGTQTQCFTPNVAGIIKSKEGECRSPKNGIYIKDWTTEKEVRLKIGIQRYANLPTGNPEHDALLKKDSRFPIVAVQLSKEAFSQLQIKFSPEFSEQEDFMREIKLLLPDSKIITV